MLIIQSSHSKNCLNLQKERFLGSWLAPEVVVILIVISAISAALGIVFPRWPIIVVATASWPLYMWGLVEGWWGSGVGDGWRYGLVLGTVICLAVSVAAVVVGWGLRRLTRDGSARHA